MNSGKKFVLALETAIDGGSVALFKEGKVVKSLAGSKAVSKSEDILLLVESLLEQCEVSKKAIGKIIISNGPGSLTGIRIGLATAKGLGDALSADLEVKYLLESLVIFNKNPGKIAVCLFTQKNRALYIEQFKFAGNQKPLSLKPLSSCKINEFKANFADLTSGADHIGFYGSFEIAGNEFWTALDSRLSKVIYTVNESPAEILGID